MPQEKKEPKSSKQKPIQNKPAEKKAKQVWPWVIILVVVIAGATAFGFTRLLKWSGTAAQDYLQQAETKIAKAEYQAALQDLYAVTILEGVQPQEAAQAYILLGQLYAERGQIAEALEKYEGAVKADAKNAEAAVYFLDLALRHNQTEILDEYLEKLSKQHADNGAVQVMQARWAWINQESDTADLFARAYELAPNDPYVLTYTTLFRSRADKKFGAEAIPKLEELKTTDTAWHSSIEKITTYLKVLAEVKENIPYYAALLGQVLLEMDDPKLAEVVLAEAIKAEEKYRDAYILLAEANRRLKSYSEAQNKIKTAIELDPIYGYSYYVYGLVAADQANWKQAIEMSEKAVALEYAGNSIRQTLAGYYYQTKDPAGIKKHYEILIQADKKAFVLTEEYVFLLLQFEDQYPEAKKYIDQLSEVSSEQVGLAVGAYYLYLTKGRQEEQQIRTLLDTAFKAENYVALAYYVQGLLNQDKALFARVLDLDSTGHIAALAQQALAN